MIETKLYQIRDGTEAEPDQKNEQNRKHETAKNRFESASQKLKISKNPNRTKSFSLKNGIGNERKCDGFSLN